MPSSPSFTLRQLTGSDIPAFRDLLAVMGDAFEEPITYTAAQPDDDYLGRLLRSDHFIALAAIEDGEVIGGLAAYDLPKFEQARNEIYIYDIAVAAAHRRKGVASALLVELRRMAAARGAYVMFVQAHRQDAPAVALYQTFAAGDDVLHFDIDVKDD